ncbi:hypothetical protein [Gluconobacter oxydans]|uniref:glycine-rich domain-containing protein n=1 Tax=Gluconobacter oxydans TaxID=442 RepID=UPI0039E7DAFE
MQNAGFPTKIAVPFGSSASSANIRAIPVTATDAVSASFNLGFPPNTMIPTDAGGTPPDGRDMNGILFMTTALAQQYCAGAVPSFDAAFQTAVGGYPIGCIVQDATTPGKYWRSTADANMTTPGASGASWVDFFADITTILTGITSPVLVTSSTSITAPSWATRVEVIAVGAGAGGSDCQATGSTIANTNASGGGGGAGANARAILPITSGQTLVLNIGAAGGPEGNGGATTVYVGDTLALTCNGGAKSDFTQTANSPGGYGGTVSLTLTGGVLLENSPGSPGGDGQNGSFIKSGKGGDGRWGGAGRDGQGAGESATGFGAGGGGAYDSAFSNTLYTGGSGFQGCCIYRFLP